MMDKVNPDATSAMFARLNPVAPDFEKLVLSGAAADVWVRDQLSLRERVIVRLAVLAAMGGPESANQSNLSAALNVGVSPEDIAEVFVQTLPQVGFIRLIAALEELRTQLDARQALGAASS
jgi:4-carboxymuconolactone decarboxylase